MSSTGASGISLNPNYCLDVQTKDNYSGYTSAQALHVLPKFMPTPSQAQISFMVSLCSESFLKPLWALFCRCNHALSPPSCHFPPLLLMDRLTVIHQTIFFGANDACLPNSVTGQHIPLPLYRQYLKAIAAHPAVTAHAPKLKLILITPPPIDEYRCEETDSRVVPGEKPTPRRTAEHTRLYAQAVVEIGREVRAPVVDVWTAFMEAAGWKEGMPLTGSKDAERSKVFGELFEDGQSNHSSRFWCTSRVEEFSFGHA